MFQSIKWPCFVIPFCVSDLAMMYCFFPFAIMVILPAGTVKPCSVNFLDGRATDMLILGPIE